MECVAGWYGRYLPPSRGAHQRGEGSSQIGQHPWPARLETAGTDFETNILVHYRMTLLYCVEIGYLGVIVRPGLQRRGGAP